MQDGDRRKAFIQSQLSLTDFGRGVLEGQNDSLDHNEINRYVGGSLNGRQTLWRWDWQTGKLLTPPALN